MASVKLRLIRGVRTPAGGPDDASPASEPARHSDPPEPLLDEESAVDSLTDDRLVTLASRGDGRAAEQLYRRHAAFAFNLAARIAGSTHDVEDIVHDAFLRAFDGLAKLRNPKAFRSWLGSIVVHAMRSRMRRTRLMRMLGLSRGVDPVEIDCIASEDASPRARAELAQVYALLQTMSADDRIAWTLRFVEGHDLKATAELSDCSLATVKRRIRRAQRFIEEHFVVSVDEEAPQSVRQAKKARAKGVAS